MRIQLCGATIVEYRGERVENQLPGRQGRLLFAFLVLNRHRPSSRAELEEVVWPGQPAAQSGAGLNPLVSKLRRLFGSDIIEGRSTLRIRLGVDTRIDVEDAIQSVHRAESQIALGEWKRAWAPSLIALFVSEREFLAGDDGSWVEDQRNAMSELQLRALEAYTAAAEGMGGTELPAAVRSARRLIRMAPLRESGYQLLMRALSAQGNAAEALGVYADLRAVLRDELGAEPSAASQAVFDRLIRRGMV